jgi:hypothetical protein
MSAFEADSDSMSRADVSRLMKPIHPSSPNLSAPAYVAKAE